MTLYLIFVIILFLPMWIGCIARLALKNTSKKKLSFYISLPFTGLALLNMVYMYFRGDFEKLSNQFVPLILLMLLIASSFLTFAFYRFFAVAGISLIDLIKNKKPSNQH